MSNTPNSPAQPLPIRDALLSADENRRMFDAVAGRYDLLNRILSLGLDRHWRQVAMAQLQPAPNGAYLDIGCGTGDLCMDLLRLQPLARVIGIDPSTAMLDIALHKCNASRSPQVASFETGDACQLRFSAEEFDGIVSAFCIRNIVDRAAAFLEMARVTKPGARIVLLELTRPGSGFLRLGHQLYCRFIVPSIGRLLSQGDAYRYLNDSVARFPEATTIAAEMRAAGMGSVKVTPLTGGAVTLFVATRDHAKARFAQ